MTALFESLSLTIICDLFSLLIPTYLHFIQVGKPILDSHLLQIPQIYAVIQRPHTKSRLSKIGLSPKRPKMFNPSSALPISTDTSFTDTPKSLYHSHASPKRVPLGTLPMSADWLLKHLKRLLPQHQSSPIGSQTPRSQLKLMPLTMHSPQFCRSQPRTVNCTPLHSIPRLFLPLELNYNVHDKELLA